MLETAELTTIALTERGAGAYPAKAASSLSERVICQTSEVLEDELAAKLVE